MPPKKKLVLEIDEDIFDEVKMQVENFLDDFYGEERKRIIVETPES